jgi:hypothetical protein
MRHVAARRDDLGRPRQTAELASTAITQTGRYVPFPAVTCGHGDAEETLGTFRNYLCLRHVALAWHTRRRKDARFPIYCRSGTS